MRHDTEPHRRRSAYHALVMTTITPGVRVCFASFDTAEVSELCIRSMRALAGTPFRLSVGDCGSTDGSVPMFERFRDAGVLDLEVAPNGRRHGEWIDQWLADTTEQYLVVCDSDVEFLADGWLAAMVETARSGNAALVATRIQARDGVPYTHPGTGARATLAPRPEPWLMMIDTTKVRGVVSASFLYEERVLVDGTKVAYDTAAAFFRELTAAGLPYVEMPMSFADAYRHYSGLTWQLAGMPWRRRLKQFAKYRWVRWRLRRARRLWP